MLLSWLMVAYFLMQQNQGHSAWGDLRPMSLHVSVVEKSFRNKESVSTVLSKVSFVVPRHSILGIYGPSGCGKSTLLRIIAGLDTDYSGYVTLDGKAVTHPTRDIGLTVQTLVSYDWLTVAGNITFGLRYAPSRNGSSWLGQLTGSPRRNVIQKAEELASIVGLTKADLTKYPEEMSGGMKQRMAFARALLPRPEVLLLDEPFSSLDFESRQWLQEVVLRVRDELGTSFICVSHDPEEILYLADEVIVLRGSPATVIDRTAPALPDRDKRYTQEFQHAKKALYELLNQRKTSSS
jgi:ABC-type nitrate/sulfonate/bicarbonate transport system ATPase subunit